jgi:hypothetical protein
MADRKPEPQPIVRGPAVQGQGQAAQERHESSDAGKAGARTVEGPGAVGPGGPGSVGPQPTNVEPIAPRPEGGVAPPGNPNKDTPPREP